MPGDDLPLRLAGALLDVVRPVEAALADEDALGALLLRQGWRPPDGPIPLQAVRTLLAVPEKLPRLVERIDAVQRRSRLDPDDLVELLDSVKALVDGLRSVVGPSGGVGLPAPLDQAAFWQSFPPELVLRLLADYLEVAHPAMYAPLLLSGVIDEVLVPAQDAPWRVDYTRVDWHWENVPELLVDPVKLAGKLYGWGAALDHVKLLSRLERVLLAFGFDAGLHPPHHELLDDFWPPDGPIPVAVRELRVALMTWRDEQGMAEVGLSVLPIPARGANGDPTGLLVAPCGNVALSGDVPIGGPFVLRLRGSLDASPFGLELRPDGVGGHATTAGTAFDLAVALAAAPNRPWTLFGGPDTHRLEVSDLALGLELVGTLDDPELRLALRTTKVELVIDFGDADGFLAKVIGTEPQRFTAAAALRWSSKTGLSFEGTGSFRILVPVDLQLGVVELDSISAGLGVVAGGAALDLGVTGGLMLGPVSAAVQEVGVRVALRPRGEGDPPGMFGDLNLEIGFKPPSGVGLAIDVGVVRGGGFVYFDHARGQYGGVLQLEFAETISLKALGLISTRLPDGSPGFSLVVLVTVEGFTPIQLGMGFTLSGVGGLLGVNRSVDIQTLRGGLKTGTLDSVLFPADPVRNAPAILSTLDSVFPARRDHHVLGPMAIIGWGSPTLLTLKLGLLLEFPDPTRLILLGRLALLLPNPKKPVARIQMDSIGVLDFDKGELSLDATLFDSRLLEFVLTGDMALRISWGAEPQFLLSVGGFNPRFPAPAGLRPLDRLAISLAEGDNPRLRLEAYLAITSNTLQFGSRMELYAEKAGFSVEGHLGFDALVTFVPFGFVVDLSASVALRFGGQVVLSVFLEVTLSGPSPWRAVGSASFQFLLIKASVAFDLEIGGEGPQAPPEPVDVRGLLEAALADPRNWASTLPNGVRPLVSLRDAVGEQAARVHPLAVLTVHQRVAPLNRPISRYGTVRLPSRQQFQLSVSGPDGADLPFAVTPTTDAFARGQYEDLRDDQKLTLPSFESMDCGLRLGRDDIAFPAGSVRDATVGYETWLWDPDIDPEPQRLEEVHMAETLPEARPLTVPAGMRP
jgi:hypothetical protein